ncbi:hypothetical protein D3C80_1523700 [compost metagenome]
MQDNDAPNNNLYLLQQYPSVSFYLHELLQHLLFSSEPKYDLSYAMILTSKSVSIGLYRVPEYKSGEFVRNKDLRSKHHVCELSMLLLR